MLHMVTLALSKGRVLRESLPILREAGIFPVEDIFGSRKLMFATNIQHLRLVILRGVDVPTYVQFGAADLGITGKDQLLEHGGEGYYEPLDLKIAPCRLMTAALPFVEVSFDRTVVATKYVNVARRFYAEMGRQTELIKLYGAMELAPILDLSDEIVDIVDTGNTLAAHGLVAKKLIANVSSRLIVNKIAMKTNFRVVDEIINSIRNVVGSDYEAI
ncbi:MAG: ATP phosphoribosyltransferase [Porticoccaceae bacterium]|nr:ATP phosphoribosyltransferase [Porticoccaceae bacterium]